MTDKEKQEQEALDKAAKGAMDDLDKIEKSLSEDKKEETDIADLEKAIAETEEGLKKSDDGDGDGDGGGGDDDGGDGDGDDDLNKSIEGLDPELAEELVKASEAYASLEKSVTEQGEAFDARFDRLEKSVTTLTRLAVGQAKVIASLTKSLERVGEKPMKKSQAQLGDHEDEPMKKSRTEVKEVLEKAVREKKDGVPGNILSFLDAYGVDATLARIPEATLGELGLK